MTEKELDAFMSKVLLDAIAFDEDRLEEKIPYAASARHRRQMRAMLKDPVRWTRERGKPVWKRVLQTAAVILLMLSLGLGSVMLASPTARATIVRWVTEWYETHIVFRYAGEDAQGEMSQYELGELPEGIASMSTNELAAEENRLNQTAPQTIAAEHEKWATIAMLKQKLVEHGKNSQTSYKTGITTNALLQFIRNRMENNTLFLLFVENAEDGLPKTLLSNECEKARTENIILTDFEKRVQEESENIYSLWNEYWSNIIQQTPPFYYE